MADIILRTGGIKYVYETPLWIKPDSTIEDMHANSAGVTTVVYSRSANGYEKAWPVDLEYTDLVSSKWFSGKFGPEELITVLIGDKKPDLDINLVKAVSPSDVVWQEPSKSEPESSTEDKPADDKVSDEAFVVTASSLNVREAPSTSARKIASLSKGDEVRLVGLSEIPPGNPFVKIIYTAKAKNQSGYVSSAYLAKKGTQLVASTASSKKAPAKTTVKQSDLIVPEPTIDVGTVLKWTAIGTSTIAFIIFLYSLRKKNNQ